MLDKNRRERFASSSGDVDLSPLIDVTFLLLIFFVVTSTFTRDADVEIERPSAASAAASDQAALRIAVDQDGDVFIDGTPTPAYMVQRHVERQVRLGLEEVLLIVDKRADAGLLVELVDQCRLAGAQRVAVAAEGGE